MCLLETGYNTFMTTSNRCIPLAIAVYRYCCTVLYCVQVLLRLLLQLASVSLQQEEPRETHSSVCDR